MNLCPHLHGIQKPSEDVETLWTNNMHIEIFSISMLPSIVRIVSHGDNKFADWTMKAKQPHIATDYHLLVL